MSPVRQTKRFLVAFAFIYGSYVSIPPNCAENQIYANESENCPSFFQRLLHKEISSKLSSKIDSEWLDVRGKTNVKDATIKFIEPKTGQVVRLFGAIEEVSLGPDYSVLKVASADGRTHFIDPKVVKVQSVRTPPRPIPKSMADELTRANKKNVVKIDEQRLKGYVCSSFNKNSQFPQYKALEKIVNRHVRVRVDEKTRRRRCIGAQIGSQAFGVTSVAVRISEDPGTWLHDHSSNFLMGLMNMAIMDQCLSALSPAHRNEMLAATLGANVVGNVWEEVDLSPLIQNEGLPIFSSRGRKVTTDLEDLKSGALATLTYLVGIKLIENQVGKLDLKNYCRK